MHPSGENPFVPTTNYPDPFTTIALAWPVGDPALATIDAKRDAIDAYAAQFS
jgi:hypothetical protein